MKYRIKKYTSILDPEWMGFHDDGFILSGEINGKDIRMEFDTYELAEAELNKIENNIHLKITKI